MYSGDNYETQMRHGTGNSLQVILKVTERCNIACKYCYYFFGGDDSFKDDPACISRETADQFVRFVRDARETYHLERIRIILHGGEPLLLPKPRMRELLTGLRKAAEGSELQFTVQTNAMLVNEEWLRIFEDFNVFVGVSLDGPAAFNDEYRVDHAGRGTYERVRAGIDRLFEAYAQGRISRPGVLSVMNPEFPAATVYKHFVEELGFRIIDFLLPDNHHDSMTAERKATFAAYVRELVGLYLREERPGISFRLVDKVISGFGMSPYFHSVLHRFATQKEVTFTVSSAGDIAPDDILRTTDPSLMKTGLNVATASLGDVLRSPGLNQLLESFYRIPTGCQGCDWANVCRGGELYHRYSNGRGFDNPSVYCDALKILHEEIATACLLAGAEVEQLRRRLDSAPLEAF
jgi:uncharacterized protein